MKKISFTCMLFALAACADPYAPTMHADYAIQVTPTAQGDVAVPPACPSYATERSDPFDNQPMPQFGCSTARNLASMVENPDDLVQGRALDPARGTTLVGAVRRYDNNQARGLIIPGAEANQQATTTAPTASSAMTGDVTGAASSSSSSSSASAASAAGTP